MSVVELLNREPWTADALCAMVGLGDSVQEAKRVCAACPVTAECLGYALDHGIRHDVWGGLTAKERRGL